MSFHQFPVRFGKYIVLDRISAGGMAEVYRAKEIRENGFSRIIAIKSMLPAVANDAAMEPMFVDEAKLAARLAHPNIAQTYELGRIDASLYIAMELVWGRDLKTISKVCSKSNKPFPVPVGCYVVAKAAEALDFAHHALGPDGKPMRLVHRDVSPHNLMLGYDGDVKVIDFGVAKADIKSSETVAGVIKGKFSYMAPEQVTGASVDARTDVFALGIVLYEVLSGERLYDGSSAFSIFDKVVNQDAPRLANVVQVAPELDAIVAKCLAKKPEDRFDNAGQLADALSPFLIQERSIIGPREAAALMRELFPGDEGEMRERLQRYQAITEKDCIDSPENFVEAQRTHVLVRGEGPLPLSKERSRSQGARTASRGGGSQSGDRDSEVRNSGVRDTQEFPKDTRDTASQWGTDSNDARMVPTAMFQTLIPADPLSRTLHDDVHSTDEYEQLEPAPPPRNLAVGIGIVALLVAAVAVVGIVFKNEIMLRLGVTPSGSVQTIVATPAQAAPPAPVTIQTPPPAPPPSPALADHPVAETKPPPVGVAQSPAPTSEPPLAHAPMKGHDRPNTPSKAKVVPPSRDSAAGFAFVSIRAKGTAIAKVFIDGKEVGYSPVLAHKLKPGQHAVKIVPYTDEMPGKPKVQIFNLGKESTQGSPMRLVIDVE